MEDWTKDPNAKLWVQHVLEDMKPKMESSALVCQIVPDDDVADAKFWVELGASIMMDKPIVAVAFEGRSVPKKLRMIADEIVILPEGMNPDSAVELQEAFERVLKRG